MKKTVFVLEKLKRGNWLQWRHEYVEKVQPFLYQYNTNMFQYFPVLISNNLASILQLYSLAYSETCQTSEIESSAKTVMRKNSIPVENLYFFDDFSEQGECRG